MTTIVFDDDFNPPRYSRTGHVAIYPEVPCTFRAVAEPGPAVRGRVLLLQGTEQNVIATGEWSDGPRYELTIDEQPDPLQPLVVTVEVDAPDMDVWVIARAVYVGEPPDPSTPRWLATHTQKMRGGGLNQQGIGYVWWSGEMPQRSAAPYKHRPGGKWDWSRWDFFVQRMSICISGDCFPEFVSEDGWIAALFAKTQYDPDQAKWIPEGIDNALFRDGPRNIGSVSFPSGGFVDDDESLIVASSPGRIVRIDTHGNVHTLAGYRMKNVPATKERDLSVVEFVGTLVEGEPWTHIWDVQKGPDGALYVADVNHHCIRRLDRSTGELTVFAGSTEGNPGHVDAEGHDARFFNPRGIAFKDGAMYVGDAVNHAIRRINMDTREVTTLVESAQKPNPATLGGYAAALDWAQDSAFGEARFMHPQHVRFLSDGRLVTVLHHQGSVVAFDFENQRVDTIVKGVPRSDWRNQRRTWLTLDVDDGSAGEVDTIYTNGWEHWTDHMFNLDGEEVGPFEGFIFPNPRVSNAMGWDALTYRAQKNGYSQFTVVGKGAVWWGGVSGAGIHRMTPVQDGETFDADTEKYQRGQKVWLEAPDPLRPSLSLIHGPWGMNGYGNRTIDDLGRMSRDEFDQWLVEKDRTDLTDEQSDDLFYFIQNESITARGMDDPDAAILPDESIPEPPEEDEPEPEPEPEEHPALRHIRDAEVSLKKAKEQF